MNQHSTLKVDGSKLSETGQARSDGEIDAIMLSKMEHRPSQFHRKYSL